MGSSHAVAEDYLRNRVAHLLSPLNRWVLGHWIAIVRVLNRIGGDLNPAHVKRILISFVAPWRLDILSVAMRRHLV